MRKVIDASHGEGGGQIIRTAVALAAVTRTEIELRNMRRGRSPSGLGRQHIAAVKAVAEISDASVEGVSEGSERLVFEPNGVKGGRYEVDVGTAGSVSLVIQAVLPLAVRAESEIRLSVRGGTDVRWSPTYDYLENVSLPLLRKAGVDADVELGRRGYYPKGGGEVTLSVRPSRLTDVEIVRRGGLRRVRGISHVSNLDDGIAERQATAAEKRLRSEIDDEVDIQIQRRSYDSFSTGTGISLWAEFDETVMGGSSLGEMGKPAEEVGEEAAEDLLRSVRSDAAVDVYSGDQLIPYIAVGGGKYTAPEETSHLQTNAWVCEQLTGSDVETEEEEEDDYNRVVVSSESEPEPEPEPESGSLSPSEKT
ncbi:MAG: RNA 3'-terminal phosphate cyclase [Halobacteria archaeon]|nr:RNA 3'-terminal phosphate cyclase [Halobacteria archaeon]